MERLGPSLEAFWSVLEVSLEGPGASWRRLGGSLGASWAVLDASWETCRFSNDLKPS